MFAQGACTRVYVRVCACVRMCGCERVRACLVYLRLCACVRVVCTCLCVCPVLRSSVMPARAGPGQALTARSGREGPPWAS